jgi:hypothetical protein
MLFVCLQENAWQFTKYITRKNLISNVILKNEANLFLLKCSSQAFRYELQSYVKEFIPIIQPGFKTCLLIPSRILRLQQSALCIRHTENNNSKE